MPKTAEPGSPGVASGHPAPPSRPLFSWMAVFALSLPLGIFALIQVWTVFQALPSGLLGSDWGLLLSGFFLFGLLLGLILFLVAWRKPNRLAQSLERITCRSSRLFSLVPAIVFFTAFLLALWLRIPGSFLTGLWTRLALFYWVVLAGTLALRACLRHLSWQTAGMVSAVTVLVVVQAVGILQRVTNDPFSQGWSEGSLLYYASLVFSSRLYGTRLPVSMIYPTRALLDSLPFLFGGLPIWVHRLWGALLVLSFSTLTAFLLVRRLPVRDALFRAVMTGAVALLLLQVNVKYEVQVAVMLVLAGVNFRRPWRSLLFLALASFWAGMSRMNWVPVPAALALLLFFLERPVTPGRGPLRYLLPPAAWFLFGVIFGLLGFLFSLRLTDTSLAHMLTFSLSRSYWYRLLPNPLYPPGVLAGILVFSLPLFLLIAAALRRAGQGVHVIRRLGAAAVLTVLFAGGLLVSSKIGGGGDLHNMDAFWVALLFAAGLLAFGDFAVEAGWRLERSRPAWILSLLLIVLAGFVFFQVQPYRAPDRAASEQALEEMRPLLASASAQGEVLFLSQRHLLLFGGVGAIPLVPEYETVELSGLVYTDNYPRVDAFQEDLQAQRFSLIVAGIQKDDIQDIYHHPFAEENNLWVDAVSRTLLCYYQPVLLLPDQDVALYVPGRDPACSR